MRTLSRRFAAVAALFLWATSASAQSADEIIEKSLTAIGGRAALAKLKSRSITGTITLSLPAGEVSGPIEILHAAPNKMRSLIKVDLSSLGAGQLVREERFDGKSGYVLDSLQGNREMTGKQLEFWSNDAFPTHLLNYKGLGISVRVSGKEKVGDRDAYLLIFEPPSGSAIKEYFDAETYLALKFSAEIDVPELGQVIELATELLDYRDVDGIKLPFRMSATSAVTNYTVRITKVEHNVPVDDAMFSKPAAP